MVWHRARPPWLFSRPLAVLRDRRFGLWRREDRYHGVGRWYSDPNDFAVQTRTGWTAGAGIETPFTLLGLFGPNWTTKTEYLYVDLGRSTNGFTLVGRPTAGVLTTDVKEHILRTGLSYHFNTPVVARY